MFIGSKKMYIAKLLCITIKIYKKYKIIVTLYHKTIAGVYL